MSEYQYLEFLAIDRPLSEREMDNLRDTYNQHATLAAFQKEFQKFMTEHLRRRALVQRLVKAGLWRDK